MAAIDPHSFSSEEESLLIAHNEVEDGAGVVSEPFPMSLIVRTKHWYNAVRTEKRPASGQSEDEDNWMEGEHLVYTAETTQATCQSWLPFITDLCGGNCMTSREETTHKITITSRRLQIGMDEATGCWPSTEEDHTRVGHSLCCLCGCMPGGVMQSKVFAVGDVAGYTRIMTIPRLQYLSTYRCAVSFWGILILLTYAGMCLTSQSDVQATIDTFTKTMDTKTKSFLGVEFPSIDMSDAAHVKAIAEANAPGMLLVEGGAYLALLIIVAYVILDRCMTWGWKFIFVSMAMLAPIVIFSMYNFELMLAKFNILGNHLSPYACLYAVLLTCGKVSWSLPVFLLTARLYIVYFGVRNYRLRLNFANQGEYTLQLTHDQVNNACAALARLLGPGSVEDAVDVKGAGIMDDRVDMPVCIPGALIGGQAGGGREGEIDFTGGGGGAKITNAAVACHKEDYAFWPLPMGPEVSQVSTVLMHSPRAKCSLLTKMVFNTNFVPYKARFPIRVLGLIIFVNGLVNYLANSRMENVGIGKIFGQTVAAVGAVPAQFGPELRFWCPPAGDGTFCPLNLHEGAFFMIFGFFLVLFPVLAGCCYGKLDLDFCWGSKAMSISSTYENAEHFMNTLVRATAISASAWVGANPDHHPAENDVGEGWTEEASGFFESPRTLELTNLRIKVSENDNTCVTTYWRTGLTEIDVGPISWSDPCCDLLPCQAWRRPREDDLAFLSMNFGWQRADRPEDAMPGTELECTLQFVLSYEEANKIIHTFDGVIGNYSHHVWSPDQINF